MNEPDFKLTAAEIHSAAWQRIKTYLEGRLDAHRKNNDGNLSPEMTTKLRGRIAEIQNFLGVGIPDVPEPTADHDE